MKISLTDQYRTLPALLPVFAKRPLSYVDHTRLPECMTARLIPTRRPIEDLRLCNVDSLFDYAIFPPSILRFAADWQAAARAMQIGDVIVQQAYLPPFRLSVKCIFAVRVLGITRTPTFVGIQYGTLAGHAETGLSEFGFERRGRELYALIHTFSEPAQMLSRIVAPFVTRPYQQYCTDRAVEQMCAAFRRANPTWCADSDPTTGCG